MVFAEPCGLEDIHDMVPYAHQAVVNIPNKRAQTRETHFECLKDMRLLICPNDRLFRSFEPKSTQVRKKEIVLLNFLKAHQS